MFGTTPEGGKAKLCIGIEKGFFEKTLLWMVELANERIVQTGLPFLDEGYFKTAVVHPVGMEPKYSAWTNLSWVSWKYFRDLLYSRSRV